MSYSEEYISKQTLLDFYTVDDPYLNDKMMVPLPIIRENIIDIPAEYISNKNVEGDKENV